MLLLQHSKSVQQILNAFAPFQTANVQDSFAWPIIVNLFGLLKFGHINIYQDYRHGFVGEGRNILRARVRRGHKHVNVFNDRLSHRAEHLGQRFYRGAFWQLTMKGCHVDCRRFGQ